MLVVERFLRSLAAEGTLLTGQQTLSVFVVGGSERDPEVAALRALEVPITVRCFGVDAESTWVDLNSHPELDRPDRSGADLVLCSQVLEHIWNHANAFQWLFSMVRSGGLLWLAAPASNRPHGSPDYFSAGFSDRYLAANATNHGFEVLDSGVLGSKRLYVSALTSESWLTRREHSSPVLGLLRRRPTRSTIRKLPSFLRLQFWNPRIRRDIRFATESWLLARRP